ncbi:nucleoside triphosphate hydrolase protein [Wolfiporia cocos MD-104 SS10]|uniref:Nucleoside triphosphate hydrolase protein n=1 Tax=Wolfiporia cocos (strain MD-104) TaxID=742152 RepID=A0A2H3JBY7_WOLCO|nr:nucleoside triphosphate hydrolase protein [Wolfiporia cocos MD-104 SS10]
MAKRRAVTINSDDEDGLRRSSQSSKRARTNDVIEDEADEALRTSKSKRKGKERQRDDEDADEEEDEDEESLKQVTPDEDEEKRFEEEHEEEIREKLMSKGRIQGGVAEMGIIESLEMHHFMCHRFLTFKFGPQINFIIGHNGSGKSAVLSALTVALGGKATSTGRGSGLKSFIREGAEVAEVTVAIKNQGEEAYRPRDYGKTIYITRRFTKEGASSYKIRSAGGQVISNKREELSAICDHMNIQVDNPMNILTQDAARQFLSASQPADKYKFFLRGTQLGQLSEEYQICLEHIGIARKTLLRKREDIPDLQDRLDEATARFREAAAAREQRHKADELKKELAWAHVASKEQELSKQLQEVAKLERRIPKIQADMDKTEAEFQRVSNEIAALEGDSAALGDIATIMSEKEKLTTQIRENKSRISSYRSEEGRMDQSIKNIKQQIEGLQERIQTEQARILEDTQFKRDETSRQLEEAKHNFAEAEQQLQTLQEEKAQKIAEIKEVEQRGKALQQQREGIKSRVDQCQNMVQRCLDTEKSQLAPFGRDMDKVLAEIQRANWYGNKPVGPIGMYVKLRDAHTWAPLMRVQLGNFMSAFALTDARDRSTLDRILRKYGNGHAQIIIAEVDIFDYSRGEPPPEVLTVLRALDVSDPYVLRVLINSAHIESTVIAPSRSEADAALRNLGRGVAWSADLYRVMRYAEGGGQSNPLSQLNRGDPRQMLFSERDPSAEKRRWQEEFRTAEQELLAANEEISSAQQRYNQLKGEIRALNDREARQQTHVRDLKAIRDTFQDEANEEVPITIQGLEQALHDMEEEKAFVMSQFQVTVEKRVAIDETQVPLLERLREINDQISNFESERAAITTNIEKAVIDRMEAQSRIAFYNKKLAEEQAKIDDTKAVADNLQTEFQNWTVSAEEYCNGLRVDNPRPAEEIQRSLDAVQAALREREKRHGATIEEMTIEVNKAKQELENAKKDFKSCMALNRTLKRSMRMRLARWQEFRRHIALRCKVYFQYHLSNRGYYGKVLFDHTAGTLQLKVQTDDQTLTQNSREKDPRSLSGGEKSFSTICLLLSLWESIGCPIRCLDEFDVFMDAVNRRISMKMMIETANASERKQYVLITPQDMTNIPIGNTVRVHRMTDPERGQGVLGFA